MTTFDWIIRLLKEYGSLFLKGTGYTMAMAVAGTLIGLFIGLFIGVYRTIPSPKNKGIRVLKKAGDAIVSAYVELFRGTPMLVQALLFYYGFLSKMEMPLVSAIIIISINTGAYMAEIVRGGIISVDKGQFEGAHAIGMTHGQTMLHVVLPQAMRNIMPSIGNEFVVNIKDSSVLNVISVNELFFMSKSAAGTYLRYFEVFFITACIYLVLTFTVTRLLRLLERRMDGKTNYIIYGSQSDSKASIMVPKEGGVPND